MRACVYWIYLTRSRPDHRTNNLKKINKIIASSNKKVYKIISVSGEKKKKKIPTITINTFYTRTAELRCPIFLN